MRMSDRSSHRVAAGQSNSSSVSIFQVSWRAMSVAPASWSNPAAMSFTLAPSVHRRVVVVTRSRVSPLPMVAMVTNCRKNCCCCCAGGTVPALPSLPPALATSKNTARLVSWLSEHNFHAVVPPLPMDTSATEPGSVFLSSAAHGPTHPATLTSRDVITSKTPPLLTPSASSPSEAKRRAKDVLNTVCANDSASTTIPPVFSEHTFISASPTWSSEHANTSRQCPLVHSCVATPS
mmetsp:Transcript_22428/g.55498  ORF Transcript_22428/g.55498 Transcript_22428/m.55498 type:complete len:235 (-) Transcript_22428:336-1040(-)